MNPRAAVNGSGRYSASEKGPRARRLRLALDKSGSAIPGAEGARAKGETHPGDFGDRKNHAAPAGVINPSPAARGQPDGLFAFGGAAAGSRPRRKSTGSGRARTKRCRATGAGQG